MAPALIIIDLQNDFVSPTGTLGEKHIPIDGILSNLATLCTVFKAHNLPILAVRSEYAFQDAQVHNNPKKPVRFLARPPGDKFRDVPMNDTHLSSAHVNSGTGKTRNFCAPGTEGAEFPGAVKRLVEDFANTTITKKWYSAFTETELDSWLKEKGVDELFFVGVTANNCVLASLTDAFFLG